MPMNDVIRAIVAQTRYHLDWKEDESPGKPSDGCISLSRLNGDQREIVDIEIAYPSRIFSTSDDSAPLRVCHQIEPADLASVRKLQRRLDASLVGLRGTRVVIDWGNRTWAAFPVVSKTGIRSGWTIEFQCISPCSLVGITIEEVASNGDIEALSNEELLMAVDRALRRRLFG